MRLDFEHSCCGARVRRASHKSPDGALTARSGLMVLVYDRPLLRSSARGDGAVTSNNDRFTNVRTYAASDLSEPLASIPLRCIETTLANLTTSQASHPGTRIPLRCRQYAKTLLRKLVCSIRGVLSVTDEGSTKSSALCP